MRYEKARKRRLIKDHLTQPTLKAFEEGTEVLQALSKFLFSRRWKRRVIQEINDMEITIKHLKHELQKDIK